MDIKTFNTSEINDVIRQRRSIYPPDYTGEEVDDQIVHQMLENANWAPTHKMTQPWSFTVFKGEGLKKLSTFQSHLYKEISEKEGTYQEKTFNKLMEKPLSASHVIGIGMKRQTEQQIPEVEEVAAVSCAVQNMMLTATAYGIGCYWGSGGITYWEEAKPFFGLNPEDMFLGFLFVGVPSKWHDSSRDEIENKVTWIQ